jgi:site-specific DNA recombinase
VSEFKEEIIVTMSINNNNMLDYTQSEQLKEGHSDMKLIGYIRVSTAAQEDNTSLDEQERRLKAYCEAYDHKLVKIYREVASAKNTIGRPAFNEALKALAKADGIVSTKLDRVARSTRDVLTLIEDVLQPSNKALILLDQNIDTSSPYGMMVLTMMAAVAQLERDVIRERTQGGRKAKSEKGGYAYGSPSFGYMSVDGVLVQNPMEYPVLQLMKNHRRAGKGLTVIANMLNELGHRTKRGTVWTAVKVGEAVGTYERGRGRKKA